jgi:hypothetical protein
MDKGKAVALVLLYDDVGRCGNRACRSRLVDFRVDEIRHVGLAPLILQLRRRCAGPVRTDRTARLQRPCKGGRTEAFRSRNYTQRST